MIKHMYFRYIYFIATNMDKYGQRDFERNRTN